MDSLSGLRVLPADPADPAIQTVLQAHHALMRATSPEESCHVLAPEAVAQAGLTLLAARDGDLVLGVGGWARLSADHGELKSMHTTQAARGRGVGQALLRALIEDARAQGIARLSLETGSQPPFAPARALYAKHGFTPCPPFGNYREDPLSVFMTRTFATVAAD